MKAIGADIQKDVLKQVKIWYKIINKVGVRGP